MPAGCAFLVHKQSAPGRCVVVLPPACSCVLADPSGTANAVAQAIASAAATGKTNAVAQTLAQATAQGGNAVRGLGICSK